MATTAFELPTPSSFHLAVATHGHGWVDLEPFHYDPVRQTLHFTWLSPAQVAQDVQISHSPTSLRVSTGKKCASRDLGMLTRCVTRMLRLDQDLSDFWARCDSDTKLNWVRSLGAGRLLRGATLFEDLIKLLFTTNCSWAATRKMTQRLVASLGSETASGRRTFPTAASCAEQEERFWRDTVRAGYRAKSCQSLSRSFADGSLSDAHFAPELATDELRRRLLALPGFGPYAAGQAMRLLGHYADFALDSWCRNKLMQLAGSARPPALRTVQRRYAAYGPWRGLALWMELTADWFVGDTKKI